jgi:hypothetical protein
MSTWNSLSCVQRRVISTHAPFFQRHFYACTWTGSIQSRDLFLKNANTGSFINVSAEVKNVQNITEPESDVLVTQRVRDNFTHTGVLY